MATGGKTIRTETRFFKFGPFTLRAGGTLPEVTLAYETYGELNKQKNNAILLFHAMTGSQHAAGYNPCVPGAERFWKEECYTGWWDGFIGPGKALDTDRFFIICANYLGGCYGSTGPSSINPETGTPYGSSFPSISLADVSASQARLLQHLGVHKLHAVTGASTGGLLCLSFATLYPEISAKFISIACGPSVTTLQRIHILEQIYALENDANFNGGDYYDQAYPTKGLALARMICHKTFVSINTLSNRAERVIGPEADFSYYNLNSNIESYMLHQGAKFVGRFDANSYLRILDMWQSFNIAADAGVNSVEEAFGRAKEQEHLIFTVSSDVAFYPEEQDELERILTAAGLSPIHITVHSEKGHDSFFLEPSLYTPHLAYFLEGRLGVRSQLASDA